MSNALYEMISKIPPKEERIAEDMQHSKKVIIEEYVNLLNKHGLTKRECEKVLEEAYQIVGKRPWTKKVFKVFRVSENTNSFGLHGMWLMAKDGECWEVAIAKPWDMNVTVTAMVNPDTGIPAWGDLGCEIPERKSIPGLKDEPGATPSKVIAEVWKC